MALGYALLGAVAIFQSGGGAAAAVMGRLSVFFALAAFLGWVAYRLGGRSSKAGNLVFAGILALPLLYAPWDLAEMDRRERAYSEFDKDLAIGGRSEDLRKALRRLADSLPHLEGKAAKAVEGPAIELVQKSERRSAALTAFLNAGGVDPSTLRQRGEIQIRQDLLREFVRANDDLAAAVVNYPMALQAKLEPLQESEATRAVVLQSEQSRVRILLGELCAVDQQLAPLLQTQLRLLEASWGRWSWRLDRPEVLFRDPGTLQAYQHTVADTERVKATEEAVLEQLRSALNPEKPRGKRVRDVPKR